MGKLKGFHHVIRQFSAGYQEDDVVLAIKRRLQELFSRLEQIDVQIVQAIQDQIVKKRSFQLYFMAVGKLSVYKCLSKGLRPLYLVNYLAIA